MKRKFRPMMPYSQARRVLNLDDKLSLTSNAYQVDTRVDIERNCIVMTTVIHGEPLAYIELLPNGGGLDELIALLIAGRDTLKASRQ